MDGARAKVGDDWWRYYGYEKCVNRFWYRIFEWNWWSDKTTCKNPSKKTKVETKHQSMRWPAARLIEGLGRRFRIYWMYLKAQRKHQKQWWASAAVKRQRMTAGGHEDNWSRYPAGDPIHYDKCLEQRVNIDDEKEHMAATAIAVYCIKDKLLSRRYLQQKNRYA